MPALDTKTEFQFRRVQMLGTANATALGPLVINVSREMRNRKIYFSVNFQGYTDWKAYATLTLFNGNTARQVFRYAWGSVYSNQTSSTSWNGGPGDVTVTQGGPMCSVEQFDPASFPNGPAGGDVDAIRVTGMSKVDGVNELGYSTIMFPFSWFGSIDSIAFQWTEISGRASATPSTTTAPFAEVYLGCKSIVG